MSATRIPRVLSIAGTDPTGGAGLHADLKSIAANGGYGMAVATALVAQNTQGVRSIHQPPVEFLAAQLEAVSDDVEIDAVKIGMLFDTPVIETVQRWLEVVRPPFVVLDPVMVSTSGHRLLTPPAEDALRAVLGSADLVTPNVPELAVLVKREPARCWDEVLDQARTLAATHDVLVLAKGGHLDGTESLDALVDGSGEVVELAAPRVRTRNTHGTGCSLSSAVATLRARTGSWEAAVREAKRWLTASLAGADDLQVGHGNGPISHFSELWDRAGTHRTAASVAQEWWEGIGEIRAAIDDLDFVVGLADGTLDHEAFGWYLAQDALYLRDYSRVLAAASQLAPTADEQIFWAASSHSALATELELHAGWVPAETMFGATAGPVTTAYVDHLLATAARGSYTELVAAVLPCFWIYEDVGRSLAAHANDDHPYADWLRTYGDEEFARATRRAIEIATTHAASAPPEERRRMRASFERSADLELQFFAAPLRARALRASVSAGRSSSSRE